MPRLVEITDDGPGHAHGLEGPEVTLGRSAANTLVLAEDGVSRQHARITIGCDGYVLEDLGSKNGTYVNGERLDRPRAIQDGDVIALPGYVFRFETDEPTVTRVALPEEVAAGGAGRAAPLHIDRRSAEVRVRGRAVRVSPKEYQALLLLYDRRGAVVSKEDLAQHVWPEYEGDVSDYNIHQVISRLRREIEEDPAHPRFLVTRPGFGYRLVLD